MDNAMLEGSAGVRRGLSAGHRGCRKNHLKTAESWILAPVLPSDVLSGGGGTETTLNSVFRMICSGSIVDCIEFIPNE